MLNHLIRFSNSSSYWWLVFSFTLMGIVTALLYQYLLDEDPCVLCIHIRIGFFAILIIAIIALVGPRKKGLNTTLHILNSLSIAGLFWKCRELLGVERGTIEGSCMFNAGLPEWFALERWLPALFEVRGLCGQSPEMFFGVSMAEALYISSALACLVSFTLLLASLFRTNDINTKK